VTSTPGSRTADYDYVLPNDRIARFPTERRDDSRLLVVQRATPPLTSGRAPISHRHFRDLIELVRPGDLLVANESRVRPVRLTGVRDSGAPAEALLLRPREGSEKDWEALVRPAAKLAPPRGFSVADDLSIQVMEVLPDGNRVVRLQTELSIDEVLERHGHVPLPPYLEREAKGMDRERYQTVYARVPGSVAAPTAGLHFTPELLAALEGRGVGFAPVVLHVGVGTFRPVDADDPGGHVMHREEYVLPPATVQAVEATRASGGRVWAVGTTTVRVLESAVDSDGRLRAGAGWTELFIRPPYRFRVVDALITNFHLPRSTLLMLAAAFAGYERVMDAYATAVGQDYRFYSYGDAMVIV